MSAMPNKSENSFVFLIISDSSLIQTLQNFAEEIPGDHRFISSFQEIFKPEIANGLYRGLIIDNDCLAKLSQVERDLINSMRDTFPMMFVTCRNIKYNMPEFRGLETVRRFMNRIKGNAPRKLRLEQRVPAPLRAIITSATDYQKSVRSVSLNLSSKGAFFIVLDENFPKWKIGDYITVDSETLLDVGIPHLQAEIRWISGWEDPGQNYPGIGVRFVNMSQEQEQFLVEFMSNNKIQDDSFDLEVA